MIDRNGNYSSYPHLTRLPSEILREAISRHGIFTLQEGLPGWPSSGTGGFLAALEELEQIASTAPGEIAVLTGALEVAESVIPDDTTTELESLREQVDAWETAARALGVAVPPQRDVISIEDAMRVMWDATLAAFHECGVEADDLTRKLDKNGCIDVPATTNAIVDAVAQRIADLMGPLSP